MVDEEREETVFRLMEKLLKSPARRAELEKSGFDNWSPSETSQLLGALLSAELLSEKEGTISVADKGRFFWKRVRRKRQGFV